MENIVKITTHMGALDWLCPYSCLGCGRMGWLVCGRCKKYILTGGLNKCPKCRKVLIGCCKNYNILENTVGNNRKKQAQAVEICECGQREKFVISIVGGYRIGLLKKLVMEFKFQSVRVAGDWLAMVLDEAIGEKFSRRNEVEKLFGWKRIENGGRNFQDEVIVVPLPTIGKHIRERGFDHTKVLARKLAARRGWEMRKILERRNKTVQVGADQATRQKQARAAYGVGERWLKEGSLDKRKHYLLVDDVWTTGASMEAAWEVLKNAGAEKISMAVVVMGPDRIKKEDLEE